MLNCWKLDSALRISPSGIVADLSNAFDAHDAVDGLIALDWPSAVLTRRVSSTSTQRVAFMHGDTNIAVPRLADAEHERYLSDATLNVYQIQLSLVEFGKELGSGEFGSVLSGTINAVDGSSTVRVALKVLKTISDPELEGKFISEAKLFAILQHPHIVSLVAVNVLEQPWFMALELMESDLKQYLRQGTSLISGHLSLLVGACVQVADAMMFLEKRQIIHRDLAARNIFVGTSGLHCVKLSDFGLSRTLSSSPYYKKTSNDRVPIKWMAPESIIERKYSVKSDVWSFAVLCWEVMMLGDSPWANQNPELVFHTLLKGSRLPRPETCNEELHGLFLECWNLDPALRPSFSYLHSALVDIKLEYEASEETSL